MRILNFTIPNLKPLLLNGQKQQTIRGKQYWIDLFLSRKLDVGSFLQIWFNQRSKSGEYLFDAKITGWRLMLSLKAEEESLFLADGFASKEEALEWFQRVYGRVENLLLIKFKRVEEAPR